MLTRAMALPATPRTRGAFYGDLEAPGALERMVRTTSLRGELVLLHGNSKRRRLLLNLIAQLNGLDIDHILLLAFTPDMCERLRRNRNGAARVNVLALDSDVAVFSSPYPHLHGAFRRFALVAAFDTKGGFANVNVGIVYFNNATAGGPVHSIMLEMERRVEAALAMPPPQKVPYGSLPGLFWDQNLFNKALLSAMANHALSLPDPAGRSFLGGGEWSRTHAAELRRLGDVLKTWRRGEAAAPPGLSVRPPWFPHRAEYRYWSLRRAAVGADASLWRPVPEERILLAPPWLVSADNAFGHRYKHWLYGASPPPCVLLHFVCVAPGQRSRILPMQLFGAWSAGADVLSGRRGEDDADADADEMLALADATYESPLAPRPWPQLNALHAALGGLAELAGRVAVLPALDCGGAVAPPSELEAALQANSAAAAPTLRAVRSLLDELTGVPVVLLRLTLPEAPADGAQPPIDPAVLRRAHPGLERAASRFRDSCPELLDRSKTRRRECTNFC
ncbi:hypothetical protein EMIHUDRAFT_224863 [Emiliania huxleyi CCMP1516]|uniref:Nucleotide-diphospho-sugar transferase domain-containing protein n=2 Tax=Emiliania huxleyi TaxID=2903 RepID=A0A0D3KQ57_EMIH1|nr:hypothetical protein EMIHUDRAFT_224863 [Emiliania huxleyi CCMP1516]EOD37892.1 hypothetical protein EMIHUDRAFT_224863 [Emiliania huxleyi CCMP1516]|eukprot:XP_005790321.1 hypothetical protein EMIHUDRAFT_224863 [Emiliania huxleyi CCMP1516]